MNGRGEKRKGSFTRAPAPPLSGSRSQQENLTETQNISPEEKRNPNEKSRESNVLPDPPSRTPDPLFDFDAPRIKDFSGRAYQKKRREIEKLLQEHRNPGSPRDPSKEKKKTLPPRIEKAAPRRTFFSEYFPGQGKKREGKDRLDAGRPEHPVPTTDPRNLSVDDFWFEQQEQKKKACSASFSEEELRHYLNDDLFGSDEKKPLVGDRPLFRPLPVVAEEILPKLRVIGTPPIRRTRTSTVDFSFSPNDIQELTQSMTSEITTEKEGPASILSSFLEQNDSTDED